MRRKPTLKTERQNRVQVYKGRLKQNLGKSISLGGQKGAWRGSDWSIRKGWRFLGISSIHVKVIKWSKDTRKPHYLTARMSKTSQERDNEGEDRSDATEIKPIAPRSLSHRQGQFVELFLSSSPSVSRIIHRHWGWPNVIYKIKSYKLLPVKIRALASERLWLQSQLCYLRQVKLSELWFSAYI